MNQNKSIRLSLATLFIPVLLAGCRQDLPDAGHAACADNPADSSSRHPLHAQYQGILEKYTRRGLPGVVALVYTPTSGTWMGTAGYSRLETKAAMQPCSVFMSASVAKLYHAVALLKLHESGLLHIKDKIDEYLPESLCDQLPNGHVATIKTLLNHTSGIPNPTGTLSFLVDYIQNFRKRYSNHAYLRPIFNKSPVGEPGAKLVYSDANYILIALIMDKVYGSHARAISDLIIRPLNLTNTYYKHEAAFSKPPGLVNSYVDLYDKKTFRNMSIEEQTFNEVTEGHDGMKYSVYDNLKFLKALFYDRTLLDEKTLGLLMDEEAPARADGTKHLLGCFRQDKAGYSHIYHEGGTIGSANYSGYIVDKQAIVVICSNFGAAMPGKVNDAMFGPSHGGSPTEEYLIDELLRLVQ